MYKIVAALFILMLCVQRSSIAQIEVTPLSLKDTSRAELYLNVENRFRITGLKSGDKVMLRNEQVRKLDSNTYILIPTLPDQHTLLVKKKSTIIYTKDFSVLKFPDVRVCLDTIHGTYATIEEVLANPTLVIETGNLKDWISVIAFDLGIQSRNGYEATPTMLGRRFSVYQISRIKNLDPGDKLYFENIKATCPDCGVRTLMPFTIIVK